MSHRAKVDAATKELDLKNKKYQLKIETNHGDILLDLNPAKAPEHCRNMIGLAKSGFYDGLGFHRIISGFMIQGGCPEGSGTGGPGYQIAAEFNDTLHDSGVLSMARSASPNSAGSQFFICLGRHAYLDRQYTAFGKTANEESMNVVRKIGALATDGNDRPKTPATITKITVVES
ncbi:MAG: peptidylprolyl isomerase [Pirellulaceae bacterium]